MSQSKIRESSETSKRQVLIISKSLLRATWIPTCGCENVTFQYMQVGFAPLHYASKNGHTDVTKLLIDHDAQVDLPAKVRMHWR